RSSNERAWKPCILWRTVANVCSVVKSGLVTKPGATRYRCASCGNLTRFDVTISRRTRAFHHFSLGGDLTVEEEHVLDEVVEEVTCGWCGTPGRVEALPAEGTGAGG